MNENTKITANPSLLQIGYSLCGILFFSSITYYIYDSEWRMKESSDSIMMWILISLFGLFVLINLYLLLNSKKVILTNESLIISYPFLFYRKNIDLNTISTVKEDDYIIRLSRNSSIIEIFNGKKTILKLYESKKIIITSFEVTNYKNLAENLRNITSSYFKIIKTSSAV